MRRLVKIVAAVTPAAGLLLGAAGPASAAAKPKLPNPVLTQTPPKATNSRAATFAWRTVTGTSYTCSLDGTRDIACGSPKSYTNLAVGSHSWRLTANRSGYRSSTATWSWRIDVVAPAAPVVAAVPTPTRSTSASVSWTDSDTSVVGFTCQLDAAVAAACTSPKALSGLADGSHTLTVTARDAAGNTASGHTTWVVDTTPPPVPVVTGPASPTNATGASLSWPDEAGATFTCALDGNPYPSCTSPVSLTGLAAGQHAFDVRAVDALGNTSAPGEAAWLVDLTPPAAPTLVSGPASPTNATSAEVYFTDADETGASFTCALDGGQAATCTSPWSSSTTLADGPHSLVVVARDAAGNPSDGLTVPWTVDATAPTPPRITSGPVLTNAPGAAFAFSDDDATVDHFTCSVDGGPEATCVTGDSFTVAPGHHQLTVMAVDGVNNRSAATWSWTYDNVAPAVPTATTPTSGVVSQTAPALGFTGDATDVASYTCAVDGAAAATCTSPFTAPGTLADGLHQVQVRAVDGAGNASDPLQFAFTVDTVQPTGATSAPASLTAPAVETFSEDVLGVSASSVQLRVGATAVPASVSCRSAANAVVPCTGAARRAVVQPSAALVPGQHYSLVVGSGVHDAAGNVAAVVPGSFRGALLQQETSWAIAQSWRVAPSAYAYGSQYVVSDTAGATLSYAFRGSSITWYALTGPSMGVARVYVDGTYKGLVNSYAASTHYKVAHTLSGLTSTTHTLRIVVTGVKGYSRGTGALVTVDAVKVGAGAVVTNPASSTRWGRAGNKYASGSAFSSEDLSGAAVAMTFRGTSITWVTITGPGMGSARVYLDGVLKGTVDDFSSTTRFGVKRTWALTDKVHTIRIVALGTHRTGATGSRVVLDALQVG